LLNKNDIVTITITEITENCGMSQPTFYNHSKDKYDLIVWIYIHESNEIMSKIGADGYSWRNTLLDGAHYFAEKREYFINALKHTGGQDSFLRYLQKVNSELKSFPNAKIYVNEEETSADELQVLRNIVPVTFTDGAYHNFPESQKIAEGIYFIKAKGHTGGNSIIIVENEGLFYMLHGDIT